jgi:hypothetical protein
MPSEPVIDVDVKTDVDLQRRQNDEIELVDIGSPCSWGWRIRAGDLKVMGRDAQRRDRAGVKVLRVGEIADITFLENAPPSAWNAPQDPSHSMSMLLLYRFKKRVVGDRRPPTPVWDEKPSCK